MNFFTKCSLGVLLAVTPALAQASAIECRGESWFSAWNTSVEIDLNSLEFVFIHMVGGRDKARKGNCSYANSSTLECSFPPYEDTDGVFSDRKVLRENKSRLRATLNESGLSRIEFFDTAELMRSGAAPRFVYSICKKIR